MRYRRCWVFDRWLALLMARIAVGGGGGLRLSELSGSRIFGRFRLLGASV